MEEIIIVQKGDIHDNLIISDASSTSSGSRRQTYGVRTKKEKEKLYHGPKERKSNGKMGMCWQPKKLKKSE